MKEQFKKFLNEDQDPKAIEKIAARLDNLLMSNEEVGYIAVQKNPVLNVFPDGLVVTNKRILICKPKNLGLSMEVIDYSWKDISGVFMKENILGAEFSFKTNSEITVSMDYLPKNAARKLYTYAKEQLDIIRENALKTFVVHSNVNDTPKQEYIPQNPVLSAEPETIETEEVTNYAELLPQAPQTPVALVAETQPIDNNTTPENPLSGLSKEELFEKLQNYKKLLDNGLILQGEYDALKKEILNYL